MTLDDPVCLSAPARARLRLVWLAAAVGGCVLSARGCVRLAEPEAARAAAERVDAGAAYAWLSELQTLHPRRGSPARPESVAFVRSGFVATGLVDVREELHEVQGRATLRNVLGRIPGQDGSRQVVLAAHHDTVAHAPGAIDDGGAIAAILAASRAVLAGPPPACDVIVISFDGEERGCLGAKAHLAALDAAARAKLRAALAVELVGWTDDDLVVHTIPHGFAWDAPGICPAWVPDAVRGASQEAGLEVAVGDPLISPFYQATIRVLGVQTGSDAGAYAEQGIPSAMLTGSALTNFYSGYHTATDDLSRVDPARLDDAARAVAAAAVELCAQAGDPAGELGEPYLCWGPTTLDRWALIALALLGAAGVVIPAADLRRAAPLASGLLVSCGAIVVAVTCGGSLLGVLVGLPLLLCASLASAFPAWRRALLVLGLVPFAVEGLLLYVAGQSFGFRWWGGAVETAGVLALLPCYLLLGARLRRSAGPPAEPTSS